MRAAALPLLLALVACKQGPDPAAGPGPNTPPGQLDRIAADYWDAYLTRFPTEATYVGDRRFDAALPDLSAAGRAEWAEALGALRDRLGAIDAAALDADRRVTARVLAERLQGRIDRLACHEATWDVDQMYGYQISLPQMASYQPVDTPAAVAAYVSRVSRIELLFDQQIDNLSAGLEAGRSAPRIAVERVLGQLEDLLATPVADSPYLSAAERATFLSEEERGRLRAELTVLVERGVRPALQRYEEFLRDVYLGAARQEVAVAAIADGRACYDILIRYHTGSDRSAEEIHELGKDELARLHTEMDSIAREHGAEDWRGYLKTLDADPAQHHATGEALLEHNRELVARAEAALPRALGALPPISIQVIPIESYRAADAPAAYYHGADPSHTRPAYYYVNTHEPATRPLYNMESLAFHEAVPGHHVQISIAQVLGDLPSFRRHLYVSAFSEGWALYAELLADELGLYSSPATRFGMYNYQAWRAARLVVDTGMHALGWSREQAVTFMQDSLALPEKEIENEIDRYIIWPAQALGYMIGRMEIQAQRAAAEEALGAAFDGRNFHDALLRNGALPLPVLRLVMQAWLHRAKGG